MPYPQRLINEGEEVALDLKPHWWFFSKQILLGIPLFFVIILIVSLFAGDAQTWTAGLWAVVALVWAVWLGIKFLDWMFTHFVVTSDRVIYRTGVLAKRGVEIPLARINNINFRQGIWERVIGAGDLEIESAGEHGLSNFEDVQHPDAVQQEIYRQMEANERKRAAWGNAPHGALATPAAPAAPSANVPEQIAQLAELRDKGVITAAEFETKKAQLLERM